MSAARPEILCVVDRPHWAHDRKTDALARELAGEFRIVKRYQSDVTAADITRADCILLYYWLQVARLEGEARDALERARGRLVLGICSEFELSGDWREPGLTMLNELPRAVFVNSERLRGMFGQHLRPPVHYTPNGVDTRFFRPAAAHRVEDDSAIRVGWAGSLTNRSAGHRGVHEFIAPGVSAVGGAEL